MWSTLKEGGVMLLSLKAEYLHELFGILVHERFVYSPHLFSQFFFYQYGLVGVYFTLWFII